MKKLFLLLLAITWAHAGEVRAQQVMTLPDCEARFRQHNLLLLAGQYGIDARRAQVIQARIWDLPYMTGEVNLVNPDANRFLDVGANGQKSVAVQQLIVLGGKRQKEVELAKGNVGLAELEYESLLRNLTFEVRHTFWSLLFNQAKNDQLESQLQSLDSLVLAWSVQAQKGNVPMKDVVRLQSLSLSIHDDLLSIRNEMFAQQENLKLLTGSTADIRVSADMQELNTRLARTLPSFSSERMEEFVKTNPDYLASEKIVGNSELLLAWQRSLAVPDLTIGAAYDQRGGAFHNQLNLTLGVPLPFWNRNRGNIETARAECQQQKQLLSQKESELRAELMQTLASLRYQQQQYIQSVSGMRDFEQVYQGMLLNFQKRNVSLIEFTDFMESYSQSMMFLLDLRNQLIGSGEKLNLLTHEDIF